jgi:hypothetical protein
MATSQGRADAAMAPKRHLKPRGKLVAFATNIRFQRIGARSRARFHVPHAGFAP